MQKLASLPPELLSAITTHLKGYDIGRLWFTGDRALLSRLASGGVERFEHLIHHRRAAKWPVLVSKFVRLKCLIVVVASFSTVVVVRGVDISSIPRSVEHLELDFQNAEACFLGVEGLGDIDPVPDPEWSPMKVEDPQLIVVKDVLENLRFLRLSGDSCLGSDFLAVLPESLLSLALWRNDHISNLDHLPPNLTTLELPYATTDNLAADCLAALNLRDLTRVSLASYETTTSYLSFLPPTTTRLVLTYFESSFQKRDMELDGPTTEANFPLTQALTSHLSNDDLLLPMHLVYLEIGYIKSVDIMQRLPTTLTYLKITRFGEEKCLEHLPPNLKYFRVENPRPLNFSLQVLQKLPVNLKTLKFRYKTAKSLDTAHHLLLLPRSLETLSYLHGYPTTDRLADHLLSLPPNLTRLGEGNIAPACFLLLPNTLVKLALLTLPEDADFHHLKSLTSLTVERSQIAPLPESCFASLPSTLKSLRLDFKDPIRADAILPRKLTSLTLVECTTHYTEEFWQNFPPGLEHLYLDNNPHLSDERCKWLPRDLIALESCTTSITDAGIKALPRSLMILQLPKVSGLTDEGIRQLPRGLTTLSLNSISNTTPTLLPRMLVSGRLNITNSTAAYRNSLPPRMELL